MNEETKTREVPADRAALADDLRDAIMDVYAGREAFTTAEMRLIDRLVERLLAVLAQTAQAGEDAARPTSRLSLAVIGRRHFGNPIPREWYAAAEDLMADIREVARQSRDAATQESSQASEPDRDEAIRIWHKHCDPFRSKLGDAPPSVVIDAMLEFAAPAPLCSTGTQMASQASEAVHEAIARVQSQFAGIVRAAINLIDEVEANHAKKEAPLRYTVPWGAVVALKDAIIQRPTQEDKQ